MLDKDFKQKWVAALKSGRYAQGSYRLYNPDLNTFCCLGVACAVVGASLNEVSPNGTITSSLEAKYPILKPIKGTSSKGEYGGNDTVRQLTAMNDGVRNFNGKPQSFEQIADWINENL